MADTITQIVVINMETWPETINCLESLLHLNGSSFRVLVVEMCNFNNSRYHLKHWIENHPSQNIALTEVESNIGFAGANNVALREILKDNNPDYIWLLNNDTVVEKNTLSELIHTWQMLDKNGEKPAFIGSRIIDFHSRSIIQSVGGKIIPWFGLTTLTGIGKSTKKFPETGYLTSDYVMGASMFFHKNLLYDLHLMDSNYFLYFEDVEWCLRASRKGYRNFTSLSSKVYHVQGSTTHNKFDRSITDPKSLRYLHLSYLLFFRRNFPAYLPVALFMLFKQMLGRLIRFKSQEAGILADVLFGFPKNLDKPMFNSSLCSTERCENQIINS